MKRVLAFTSIAAITAVAMTAPASADQIVRCESANDRYTSCPIGSHGYVRMSRQLSHDSCVQGRTWDYDERHIWVDDGCRAEFTVESRWHTDDHDDHDGEAAVAAIAGLAILAAAAAAASDNDDNDRDYEPYHNGRYGDDNYGRGGHSSYVPYWMRGNFSGYNSAAHQQVSIEVDEDGQARARIGNGTALRGYVNDERLYIGNLVFDLEREGNGFKTIERGNRHNVVHYYRR